MKEFKVTSSFVLLLVSSMVLFSSARGQSDNSAAFTEIARLAKVLAGDWNTVEIVQHGKPVPEGSGRRGTVHVALVGGGTALVSEGHSTGEIGGDLRWFITIWWDADAKLYRFLTCFKTPSEAGCELRGTAHWDGNAFVNDYEEVIDGKRTKIRDRWTDITPNSHTLTEAHDTGNGVMKPYCRLTQHSAIAGLLASVRLYRIFCRCSRVGCNCSQLFAGDTPAITAVQSGR